jgi:hypothetical protein
MIHTIDTDRVYDLVQKIPRKVDYLYTNENLEAITRTLDINPDDRVISICGSGAQPLAFLQYLNGNGEILAIDYNKHQIKLARQILNNMPAYFHKNSKIDIAPRNEGYFVNMQRIEQIHKNKDKINFQIMNVSKQSDINKIDTKFTKGYFSNAEVNIIAFEDYLEKGGLIYITSFPFQNVLGHIISEKAIEKSFAVDIERTKLAREIELTNTSLPTPSNRKYVEHWEWKPTVLVRI